MTTTGTRKQRKVAPLLEAGFLEAVINDTSPDATTTTVLQLTNGAANVLHDCQEEFVAQLTHHLAEALKSDAKGVEEEEDKRKIRWVQPKHVQAAMTAMGLSDILKEAMECIEQEEETDVPNNNNDNDEEPPKKKRRKKTWKKKEVFSAEMIAEQERLLAASLQKQS